MDFKEELAKKAGKTANGKTTSSGKNTGKPEGDVGDSGAPVIRLLNPTEIECRIGTIKANGLSLLLYKDARVDQKILDETFGIFGWQRSHQVIDGNLYCTVSVYDEKTQSWISKQDVGTQGYAEKEKSQASDSFKRACVNIGIGRELYSAPFIWIFADRASIVPGKDGKFYCNDRFFVRSITYTAEREIAALMIVNQKGEVVFNNAQPDMRRESAAPAVQTAGKKLPAYKIQELAKELERTGVSLEKIKERYPFETIDEIAEDTYRKIMIALSATPDRAA